ncbi:flagellin A [Campylobacter hepaticus]|uniref:flagellin A n=2 Tax=Campylobacter hepaticus TaxID=1813019 RepID=UPI0018C8F1C0|nr:flagellin A [Campylobacter hepaticus]MCZ0772049.1 flagellin A [Campylobacter hepaticus]MCZ0773518.1 flagellin A [Campylobacter hepaticus]MCZ0774768.1 flagellin A [Campylobacter hepaticus]QPM44053.1 flagellin A [Campylobacter hepaticus]WAP49156.1 flagellin A [Campylobacter hepaticus]
MGFRINTNIGALNAHANSSVNAIELDKSLSRLSSGLRINSAADDASGMAIADSLRSQASTLGQAISNGNDALGILQTADKAMDEQLKILDTIKTKATQAAQDGQSLKTRTMLQADINRLMEQLDNIANTTEFNGKQLLSGGFINQEFQVGSSSNQTIKATIGATQSSKIGVTRFETGSQSFTSDKVDLVIKNYNGVDDFKFDSVIISTSVGTGLGALAEEINKNADKTGVRATYDVRTVGAYAVKEGATSQNFSINGVTIGQINYKEGDSNGQLVSAINSVKDTTGVEASRDENGKLVLTSRDGRGIKIDGSIGAGAGILHKENYGRLSLVKNDGRDISISGTTLSAIGMGATDIISQSSVSLRESKGQLDANVADAMGFNAFRGGGKQIMIGYSSLSSYMSSEGSGFSAGSGFSEGSGKDMSKALESGAVFYSSISTATEVFNVSQGSGFSGGSGNSQFATLKISTDNKAGVVKETAGVTTLKGAMAVMDIAQTAITNLDQIRADIGSVQNQLQVTINNITVTQVNVKSAESQIRDVDFASESANFSKHNILAQSGSYAMAQANAVQQNVLKLLQ